MTVDLKIKFASDDSGFSVPYLEFVSSKGYILPKIKLARNLYANLKAAGVPVEVDQAVQALNNERSGSASEIKK